MLSAKIMEKEHFYLYNTEIKESIAVFDVVEVWFYKEI